MKAKAALAGVQIPGAKKPPLEGDRAAEAAAAAVAAQIHFQRPRSANSATIEDSVQGDTLSQLSQLGARAAQAGAVSPPKSAKTVQFTPPSLPGVGSPQGEKRTPEGGAREIAEQALRGVSASSTGQRQAAGMLDKAQPTDAETVKAGFAEASLAMKNAMLNKARMAGAARSNEL